MNYDPDHNQPRFGDFGAEPPQQQAQTSRLSILSLMALITGVLSLPVCCIPVGGTVFGLIPIVCGIGGLRAVKKSRGAVAGRGLAISGLVLGLLGAVASTLLWTVVAGQIAKMPAVYAQVLDPDPGVARTVLTSSASASLSDDQLAAFRDAFIAEHGQNLTVPKGALPVVTSFGRIGDPTLLTAAPSGPTRKPMPIPLQTDAGWTYLVVVMEQTETLGSGLPAIADAGFLARDGTAIWLTDIQPPAQDSQSPTTDQTDEGAGTPTPGDQDPGG